MIGFQNEGLDEEQESAKFNMALDTLKRLGKTLEEIKQLAYKIEYSIETRQAVKLGLIKQFFIQSSPLLPKDQVEKYKEEILSLKPAMVNVLKMGSMNNTLYSRTQIIYNEKLEIRIDEILIELQMILQKEKYFMPPAEEEADF